MARPGPILSNNSSYASVLKYPSDLGSDEERPYTVFTIVESKAYKPAIIGHMALPFPPTLKCTYSPTYEDATLQILDYATILQEVLNNPKDLGLWGSLAGRGAINLADKIFPGIQAASQIAFGKVINPHLANLFKGVGFRTFHFEYDLIAKTPEESNAIRDIIARFKYHALPAIDTSDIDRRFLLYPEQFLISLYSPTTDYLFKISLCVLENIEVNYTNSQTPAFFNGTGAPVYLSLSLQFKEIEIMTKNRIEEGY